jgi:hypothetical protein
MTTSLIDKTQDLINGAESRYFNSYIFDLDNRIFFLLVATGGAHNL